MKGVLMAIENVLVAYDDTDGAKKALELAADLAAKDDEMHIDLVYVVPVPQLDNRRVANFKEILDLMVDDAKEVLTEAVAATGDVADRVDSLIITGTNPATELVKLAIDRDYDLIVIGSRGLKGVKEYIGSVSHKVIQAVDIPVLVAK